ncbi:serine/arginine repetitive matrix protein 2 isoform X3 [Drosophila grimshawi]|nr:serine/arginine repetitive matrix protein 2 isoform X3 [Drosophila grimshawi]XP_032594357.1 serine/arginine repetitive matrix protein 2 isoform X3 [Drosophila grimshawi]
MSEPNGNTLSGYGKDPLATSHGDALLDQNFQSLKSKEVRDSMSPTHELKFHSMTLTQPNTTGWDVQTSSEVSPDGRAYRTETLAKTDGVEKLNGGGVAEFKGRNEQVSSASHQGDDKNYVKQAAESSNTHLQERVVFGDENSGRSEMKMSSTTSSSTSKFVSSSSSSKQINDDEPRYLLDNQQYQQQQQQQQQRDHQWEQQQQQQQREHQQREVREREEQRVQEQRFQEQRHQRDQREREERYSESREQSNSTRNVETQQHFEENKRYVDMDKASPEYQRHVQHLMSQPGEIISSTVEYPKPNVKMITTVKRLPDGTIVKNKRYETEQMSTPATESVRQTQNQTQRRTQDVHHQHHQTNKQHQQQHQQHHQQQSHPRSAEPRDVVDNASEPLVHRPSHAEELIKQESYSTVKKSSSSRRYSTETTSETVEQQYEEPQQLQPLKAASPSRPDVGTHGFPSTKSTNPVQEFPNQRPLTPKQPSNDFSTHGFPSVRGNKPTQEFLGQRPTTEDEEYVVHKSQTSSRNVKQSSTSQRTIETEFVDDDHHHHAALPVATPSWEQPASPRRPAVDDYSTHGFPSVRGTPSSRPRPDQPDAENVVQHSSTTSSSRKSNTERIIETQVEQEPQPEPEHVRRHQPVNAQAPASPRTRTPDYGTQGFPSARSPTRHAPRSPLAKSPQRRPTTNRTPGRTGGPAETTTTTTTTVTRRQLQKEREVDAAHRAFAASLRSSSPAESVGSTGSHSHNQPRRDSGHTEPHGQRMTPRSSVSSSRTYRRDGREGSHDSHAPSESSRISSTTVTRGPVGVPAGKSVGKTHVTKQQQQQQTVVKTRNVQGSNETIDLMPQRSPKSPAAATKTTTTTTTTTTIGNKPAAAAETPTPVTPTTPTTPTGPSGTSGPRSVPASPSSETPTVSDNQSQYTYATTKPADIFSLPPTPPTPTINNNNNNNSNNATTTTTRTLTTTNNQNQNQNKQPKTDDNNHELITKTKLSSSEATTGAIAAPIVEAPCVRRHYYQLGPSDTDVAAADTPPAESTEQAASIAKAVTSTETVAAATPKSRPHAPTNRPISEAPNRTPSSSHRKSNHSTTVNPNDVDEPTPARRSSKSPSVERHQLQRETTFETRSDREFVSDDVTHIDDQIFIDESSLEFEQRQPKGNDKPREMPRQSPEKIPAAYPTRPKESPRHSPEKQLPTKPKESPRSGSPEKLPASLPRESPRATSPEKQQLPRESVRQTPEKQQPATGHSKPKESPRASSPDKQQPGTVRPKESPRWIPEKQLPATVPRDSPRQTPENQMPGTVPQESPRRSSEKTLPSSAPRELLRNSSTPEKQMPVESSPERELPSSTKERPEQTYPSKLNAKPRQSPERQLPTSGPAKPRDATYPNYEKPRDAPHAIPDKQQPSQFREDALFRSTVTQRVTNTTKNLNEEFITNESQPQPQPQPHTRKPDDLNDNEPKNPDNRLPKTTKPQDKDMIDRSSDKPVTRKTPETSETPDGSFISKSPEPDDDQKPTFRKKGLTRRETFEDRCRKILGMEEDGDTQGNYKPKTQNDTDDDDDVDDETEERDTNTLVKETETFEFKIEDCPDDDDDDSAHKRITETYITRTQPVIKVEEPLSEPEGQLPQRTELTVDVTESEDIETFISTEKPFDKKAPKPVRGPEDEDEPRPTTARWPKDEKEPRPTSGTFPKNGVESRPTTARWPKDEVESVAPGSLPMDDVEPRPATTKQPKDNRPQRPAPVQHPKDDAEFVNVEEETTTVTTKRISKTPAMTKSPSPTRKGTLPYPEREEAPRPSPAGWRPKDEKEPRPTSGTFPKNGVESRPTTARWPKEGVEPQAPGSLPKDDVEPRPATSKQPKDNRPQRPAHVQHPKDDAEFVNVEEETTTVTTQRTSKTPAKTKSPSPTRKGTLPYPECEEAPLPSAAGWRPIYELEPRPVDFTETINVNEETTILIKQRPSKSPSPTRKESLPYPEDKREPVKQSRPKAGKPMTDEPSPRPTTGRQPKDGKEPHPATGKQPRAQAPAKHPKDDAEYITEETTVVITKHPPKSISPTRKEPETKHFVTEKIIDCNGKTVTENITKTQRTVGGTSGPKKKQPIDSEPEETQPKQPDTKKPSISKTETERRNSRTTKSSTTTTSHKQPYAVKSPRKESLPRREPAKRDSLADETRTTTTTTTMTTSRNTTQKDRKPKESSNSPNIKDRLRSSPRKQKPQSDDVDGQSTSPDTSPTRIPSERRRSSNISVTTEIIIDHKTPKTPSPKTERRVPISPIRKIPVTERKESAPVPRVTRRDKDKVTRSTSENVIKVVNGKPKAMTPEMSTLNPSTAQRPTERNRPSKCFTTKTINLSEQLINSEDMENVIIDIQHAKSSREPSPDRIVPTPVHSALDTDMGKPRYPDVVQEPDDEPRKKPIVTNIPIFEEEANAYVGCQISELRNPNGIEADIHDNPMVEAPRSLDYSNNTPSTIQPGIDVDECLLSVHEKVSKFTHTAEQVKRPKSSTPFSRQFDEHAKVSASDECLLSIDQKVDRFLKTAENITKQPLATPTREIERPRFEDIDDELRQDDCTLSVSQKVHKFIDTAEKLAPTAPQKSPGLVASIERHISRQSEPELEQESEPEQPSDVEPEQPESNDELLPMTKNHTTAIELKRQKDILNRPSVFGQRTPTTTPKHIPNGGKPRGSSSPSTTLIAEERKSSRNQQPQRNVPSSLSPSRGSPVRSTAAPRKPSLEQPRGKPSDTERISTTTGTTKRREHITQQQWVLSDVDVDVEQVGPAPASHSVSPQPTVPSKRTTSTTTKPTTGSSTAPRKPSVEQPRDKPTGKEPSDYSIETVTRRTTSTKKRGDIDVDVEEFESRPTQRNTSPQSSGSRTTTKTTTRSTTAPRKPSVEQPRGKPTGKEQNDYLMETVTRRTTTTTTTSDVEVDGDEPLPTHKSGSPQPMSPGRRTPTATKPTTRGTTAPRKPSLEQPRNKSGDYPMENVTRRITTTTTTTTKHHSDVEVDGDEPLPTYKSGSPQPMSPGRRTTTTTTTKPTTRGTTALRKPSVEQPRHRPTNKEPSDNLTENVTRRTTTSTTSYVDAPSRSPSGSPEPHRRNATSKPSDSTTINTSNSKSIVVNESTEHNTTKHTTTRTNQIHSPQTNTDLVSSSPETEPHVEPLLERSRPTTQTTPGRTVASRRNIFERQSPSPSPSPSPKPHPASEPHSPAGRRPSYMDHTKSSLEHIRRDSLEFNKTHYSRKSSIEDAEMPEPRNPNAAVKFDVPRRTTRTNETTLRTTSISEDFDIDIEAIFELATLEQLLETVSSYELRRRIRAQIRLIKKNMINVSGSHTTSTTIRSSSSTPSRSPLPPRREQPQSQSPRDRERSQSPQLKDVRTTTSTAGSTGHGKPPVKPRERSVSPAQTRRRSPTGKSNISTSTTTTTRTTSSPSSNGQSMPERRPSKGPGKASPIWADRTKVLRATDSVSPTPRKGSTTSSTGKMTRSNNINTSTNINTNNSSSTTTTTTSSSSRSSSNKRREEDSITSSYGVGPTDENGLPLFGIRALRKKTQPSAPCETKQEVTGYVIEEQFYSDDKSPPRHERKELIYSSNPEELVSLSQQLERKSHPDSNSTLQRELKLIDVEGGMPDGIDAIEPNYESPTSTRRGSVKELSERFIRKESSASGSSHTQAHSQADEQDETEDSESNDVCSVIEMEAPQLRHKSSSSTTRTSSSTRSFLNTSGEERLVSGVDDVLERMRNADNVVEPGDSSEDREARALLNKFLGASVIMQGVESMLPAGQRPQQQQPQQQQLHRTNNNSSNQGVKTTRISSSYSSNSSNSNTGNISSSSNTTRKITSSAPVTRTTCDIEEIWDEQLLRQLLEQASTYEERRKIRARLRELMAEREELKNLQAGGAKAAAKQVEAEEESSASEYEEIIEEVTDDDSSDEEPPQPVVKKEVKQDVQKEVKKEVKQELKKEAESKSSTSSTSSTSTSTTQVEKKLAKVELTKQVVTGTAASTLPQTQVDGQQAQHKQQSSTTSERTETKSKDGGAVVTTTTTKVTTRTVSGNAATKNISPLAKFKQLDKAAAQQQAQKSSPTTSTPTTPGGSAQPYFKFTDPALNARAATVKDQLLQWCQHKTQEYENVQISNFSSSWSDGLAFCALIHHFLPDAFDYSELTKQTRRHNFELAFSVADEKAGIAPLLDVEDMVEMSRPDWKCVFVYVQSIYRRFRNCQ